MTKKTTMMKPKPLNRRMRRKQERKEKKAAKRAARQTTRAPEPAPEEQKAPEPEEAAQYDSENEETTEEAAQYLERVKVVCNTFDYDEAVRAGNGMSGFMADQRVRKHMPDDHRCFGCRNKFCTNCLDCVGAAAMLECLCPPKFCCDCMDKHAKVTGTRCEEHQCIHFGCPNCRKRFNHLGI